MSPHSVCPSGLHIRFTGQRSMCMCTSEYPDPAYPDGHRMPAESVHLRDNPPRVGAALALQTYDGEVLVGLRADGMWGLPGGRVEHAEHPVATALRELTEETGIVLPDTAISLYPEWVTSATWDGASWVTVIYRSWTRAHVPVEPTEPNHVRWEWTTFSELPERTLFPPFAAVFQPDHTYCHEESAP